MKNITLNNILVVIPAKAGLQPIEQILDSRLRGNDIGSILKRAILALCMLCVSSSAFALSGTSKNRIDALTRKPFPVLAAQPIVKGTLKNGIKYYILEDHELPLYQFAIRFKGGALNAPKDMAGLANIYAFMLPNGGTTTMKPEAVDKWLDSTASTIGADAGPEFSFISGSATSEHAKDVTALAVDLLFKPAFDADRLLLAKKLAVDALKNLKDDISATATREFKALLFGKDDPWGSKTTKASISKIDEKALRDFASSILSTDGMIITVAGDIKASELITFLNERFAELNIKKEPLALPPFNAKWGAQEKIVNLKKKQANIIMGHLGPDRSDPDKFSIEVMNDILGGSGLKSKLSMRIRTELGRSYNTGSRFTLGPVKDSGLFYARSLTTAQNSGEVISEIKRIITAYMKDEVSADDVARSKESILWGLVFANAEPMDIVSRIASYILMGYPEDYLDIYRSGILKVTPSDVKMAADKYLHPDELVTVVVGDKAKIKKSISDQKKVELK